MSEPKVEAPAAVTVAESPEEPASSSGLGSMASVDSGYQAPLLNPNGEYTFSETELHSILNFMEAQKAPESTSAGLLTIPTALSSCFGGTGANLSQLPMQFLPSPASQPLSMPMSHTVSGAAAAYALSKAATLPMSSASMLIAHSLNGTQIAPQSLDAA
eukprot:scaffold360558_cov43-Prasinocladus_malaysianus.AAC.1